MTFSKNVANPKNWLITKPQALSQGDCQGSEKRAYRSVAAPTEDKSNLYIGLGDMGSGLSRGLWTHIGDPELLFVVWRICESDRSSSSSRVWSYTDSLFASCIDHIFTHSYTNGDYIYLYVWLYKDRFMIISRSLLLRSSRNWSKHIYYGIA